MRLDQSWLLMTRDERIKADTCAGLYQRRVARRELRAIRNDRPAAPSPLPPAKNPHDSDESVADESHLYQRNKRRKTTKEYWETFHASNVYVPPGGRLTVRESLFRLPVMLTPSSLQASHPAKASLVE